METENVNNDELETIELPACDRERVLDFADSMLQSANMALMSFLGGVEDEYGSLTMKQYEEASAKYAKDHEEAISVYMSAVHFFTGMVAALGGDVECNMFGNLQLKRDKEDK